MPATANEIFPGSGDLRAHVGATHGFDVRTPLASTDERRSDENVGYFCLEPEDAVVILRLAADELALRAESRVRLGREIDGDLTNPPRGADCIRMKGLSGRHTVSAIGRRGRRLGFSERPSALELRAGRDDLQLSGDSST